MPSVKISCGNKMLILQNIRQELTVSNNAISKDGEIRQKLFREAYDDLISRNKEHLDALDKSFTRIATGAITTHLRWTPRPMDVRTLPASFDRDLYKELGKTKVGIPIQKGEYDFDYFGLWGDCIEIPQDSEAYKKIEEHLMAYKIAINEINEVVAKTSVFLDNYSTTGRALKAWPELRRYLPAALIEKHDAPAAQRKAPPIEETMPELDLQSINNELAVARLVNA